MNKETCRKFARSSIQVVTSLRRGVFMLPVDNGIPCIGKVWAMVCVFCRSNEQRRLNGLEVARRSKNAVQRRMKQRTMKQRTIKQRTIKQRTWAIAPFMSMKKLDSGVSACDKAIQSYPIQKKNCFGWTNTRERRKPSLKRLLSYVSIVSVFHSNLQ
jgi:hypothetical protein